MSLFKDLSDESAAWAAIGGKPHPEEIAVRQMSLVEFLELVSECDFALWYTRGDPKTRGIEGRHEVLKSWIAKIKG